MKRNNKKGFTLAELLIVVAIIAVLVAVAIPVFTAQLEKSRDATTVANLRSAYAEASALVLSEPESTNAVAGKAKKTAANVVEVSGVDVESSDATYWTTTDSPLGFSLSGMGAKKSGGYTAQFTFNTDGTVACVLS